jgi:hypothetical protein
MTALQPVALDHSHRLCLEYARLTALTSGGPIDLYIEGEGRVAAIFDGLVVRGAPYSGWSSYTPQGVRCLRDLRRTDLGFTSNVTSAARGAVLTAVNHAITCAHDHLDALNKATADRGVRCKRRDLTAERETLLARLAEIDRGLAALEAP